MSKEKFKVGDLVTAYSAGYWEIKSIDMTLGSPVGCAKLKKIFNENGTPASGRKDTSCNLIFCKRVNEKSISKQYIEMLKAAEKLQDTLISYINGKRK